MIKLNLCCGNVPEGYDKGYICIDYDLDFVKLSYHNFPDIDVDKLIKEKQILILDLNHDKLPFNDNSVIEIISVAGIGRGYVTNFDEITRVLHPNGKMILYNSYLEFLPTFLRMFLNVDIVFINGHKNNEDIHTEWDFKFTCYNQFED